MECLGVKLIILLITILNTSVGQQSRIINNPGRNEEPYLVSGGDLLNFELSEDTRVGTVVYKLRGQDPEGSTLQYTISAGYFSVDIQSGDITLIKALDRETESSISVVITILDKPIRELPPNLKAFSRTIKVLDQNDNVPIFSSPSYSFSVPETEYEGQTLFTEISISDYDTGPNAMIKLLCTDESSPDACTTFGVTAQYLDDGKYIGLVTLKKSLDYERRSSYNLVIMAEDQGIGRALSSTANVIIQVVDVQDQNPVFLNAPYSTTVPEGTSKGSHIFEIEVRDGDTGIPRDLELSIVGDKLGYFELENPSQNESGVLTAVLQTSGTLIDRENREILNEGGLYAFKVVAKEMKSDGSYGEQTETSVTIVVTDIDDELPVFNRAAQKVAVPENIGLDTPLPGLNLEVVDKDINENAEFTLTLEPVGENTAGVFSVYPPKAVGKTPVIIRVTDPHRLDYENENARQFMFNVVAQTTTGETVTSLVEVIVTDSNDNTPLFKQQSYEFSVYEDAIADTPVGKIEAFDSDSGSFGEIRYSLKGFGSEKFQVKAETGDILVDSCNTGRQSSCLDYENQKTFSLTYTATDGGSQTTTTNVFIRIIDVNDNHPKFENNEYRRIIHEGDFVFEPQLFVLATDADGPLQGGGKVFYTIASINTDATVFEIDPISGEITMMKPVKAEDTENGRYDLVIRATDQGKPDPLHSDVKVFVNVGSITNQKPVFTLPRYDIAIRENAEQNSQVLKVKADDLDGKNSDLVYKIYSGSKDNFVIDESTGVISVSEDATLDIEQNGERYEMEVQVIDNGEPYPQTGSATVQITVQDVNNKPPKFLKESYTQYILENEPKGHHVLTVTAVDPDRNADLEYDIMNNITARDKTGTKLENTAPYNFKSAFSIDPRNGKISINEQLSYSSAAVIIVPVFVRDVNAEENIDSQFAYAEATFYVQAFNADSPVFPPPWTPSNPTLNVNVSEELPPGKPLFQLGAKDPVTGQQVSEYQKLDTEPNSQLIQISLFGEVISTQPLDFEQIKTISFTVKAIAGVPGQQRISEAHVTLHLVDVNDNAPVFDAPMYSAKISESSLPLTNVITVHAEDADTGKFGNIVYSIEGEGADEFMIDKTKGIIQVKPGLRGRSLLDREFKDLYNLRVLAKDIPNGGPDQKVSTVRVQITLTDVNDSPPKFSQSRYTAVVPENSPINTLVVQVSATDPDLGRNNHVYFGFAIPSQVKDLYRIESDTGKIFTKGSLTGKGRKSPYILTIRALDRGEPQQFKDSDLYITVGDVSSNDGVPEFLQPQPGVIAQVAEEASVGTVVYQAQASDPDDPNTSNGKIVYSFPDDGSIIRKLFAIDPNNGLITTKVPLDREERVSYILILEARDLGNPVQQTSRTLEVVVKDIDDHPPQFNRQRNSVPITIEVEEEMAPGTKIGEVVAIDKDEGQNAQIDYAIVHGNDDGIFSIETDLYNRGILVLKKRLDREESGLHILTIKCFKPSEISIKHIKKPYDRMKLNEILVKIVVIDKDDNNPSFVEHNITKGVRVNAAIYTELATIKAFDRDPTAKTIKYNLKNVTFIRPRNGLRKEIGASGFLVDPITGVIQTNMTFGKFTNGFFDVAIEATNTPDKTKSDFVYLKIFVLQDTDLMKFVFNKDPVNIAKQLTEFKKDVEKAIAEPLKVNIYDTEFYSKVDGSLDFGMTSSCFQVVGEDDIVEVGTKSNLFDPHVNAAINRTFSKYGVERVERCAVVRPNYNINWIQISILIIAVLIGLAAAVAAIVICCLYSKYKRKIRRNDIKIVEAPVRALIPTSLPPGSVMGPAPSVAGSDGRRIYEWQETAMPIDTASYRSLPR